MDRSDIGEETTKIINSVDIPNRPQILLDIQNEIKQEYADFDKIAEMINMDIALTATVLKIANSPFYGLRKKVHRVKDALMILGINNFSNVILASSLKNLFKIKGLPPKFFEDFYCHSLLVAGVNKFLAESNSIEKKCNIDCTFSYQAGLFHDCGILILVKRFKDYVSRLDSELDSGTPIIDLENSNFKTNHCVIGSYMSALWELPENVCRVIGYHHHTNIDILENSDDSIMLSLLLLSEHILFKLPNAMSDHSKFVLLQTELEFSSEFISL